MINGRVLMTDAKNIGIAGINAHENLRRAPSRAGAIHQFAGIQDAIRTAGITIEQIPSPKDQQDGVYTANWAITHRGRALLSRLPNARSGEEPYAQGALEELGYETRRPSHIFSGQGDCLPFNEHEAIVGYGYRTLLSLELMEHFKWLGLTPIPVEAKPKRALGVLWRQKNRVSGLYDSYFYDIDLAVAVIAPNVLAVCREALTNRGRRAIDELATRPTNPVKIIPISLDEALKAFAANLVSTGETVVMAQGAPKLAAALEAEGLKVLPVANDQFKLTGGGIRCVTLTLS